MMITLTFFLISGMYRQLLYQAIGTRIVDGFFFKLCVSYSVCPSSFVGFKVSY